MSNGPPRQHSQRTAGVSPTDASTHLGVVLYGHVGRDKRSHAQASSSVVSLATHLPKVQESDEQHSFLGPQAAPRFAHVVGTSVGGGTGVVAGMVSAVPLVPLAQRKPVHTPLQQLPFWKQYAPRELQDALPQKPPRQCPLQQSLLFPQERAICKHPVHFIEPSDVGLQSPVQH